MPYRSFTVARQFLLPVCLSFLLVFELVVFLGFVDVGQVIAVWYPGLVFWKANHESVQGKEENALMSDSFKDWPAGKVWKAERVANDAGRKASLEPMAARAEVRKTMVIRYSKCEVVEVSGK